MTNNKLRIAAYTRVALDEENKKENNDSIIRQKTIIENYCSKHFSNYTLDFYIDTNCSGNTFDGREDYPKLRDKLSNNEYDILIAKDFSRIFRQLNEETLNELERILKSGVRLITVDGHMDSELNPMGVMMLGLTPMSVAKLNKRVKFGKKRGEIDAKKLNRRSP